MALRPAGKTLSSLTGLLVLAAALWLLLNFVYAPSCGRFSCGYEPAWIPRAHADSGDGCPDSLQEAAGSEPWLRDRIESIKTKDVTAGVFYDQDGMAHHFASGRGAEADTALKVGQEIGVFPQVGRPGVVDHVEVKVAAAMRAGEVKSGILVINHQVGPCDPEEPDDPFTCLGIVPRMLTQDARLLVYWEDVHGQLRSHTFVGGAG